MAITVLKRRLKRDLVMLATAVFIITLGLAFHLTGHLLATKGTIAQWVHVPVVCFGMLFGMVASFRFAICYAVAADTTEET